MPFAEFADPHLDFFVTFSPALFTPALTWDEYPRRKTPKARYNGSPSCPAAQRPAIQDVARAFLAAYEELKLTAADLLLDASDASVSSEVLDALIAELWAKKSKVRHAKGWKPNLKREAIPRDAELWSRATRALHIAKTYVPIAKSLTRRERYPGAVGNARKRDERAAEAVNRAEAIIPNKSNISFTQLATKVRSAAARDPHSKLIGKHGNSVCLRKIREYLISAYEAGRLAGFSPGRVFNHKKPKKHS